MSEKKGYRKNKGEKGYSRIAVVDVDRCKPAKCMIECKTYCPVVITGKKCVTVEKTDKTTYISEVLCQGCGICVRKCPYKAIQIINLPKSLASLTTHRYGPNGFKLHRLPVPRPNLVLGLVGTNGIGKTTALNILSAKIKPNLGEWENKPGWEEVCKYFRGTELQGYFRKVVEESIRVSLKPQYIDRYLKEAKKAKKGYSVGRFLRKSKELDNYKEVAERLSLTKLLRRDVSALSGGELQRVFICKTAIQDADMYMFDEPSSYLDVNQRIAASNVIRACLYNDKKYVICVEHDLAILDYMSDFICVLFGQAGGYGIVSLPFSVREGINIFLSGFIPTENVRFREFSLDFKLSSTQYQEVKKTQKRGKGGGRRNKKDDDRIVTKFPRMRKTFYRKEMVSVVVEEKKEEEEEEDEEEDKNDNNEKPEGEDGVATTTTKKKKRRRRRGRKKGGGKDSSSPTSSSSKKVEKEVKAFELDIQGGDFKDSEILVLLGENGTGKTTLISILAGKTPPDDEDKVKLPNLNISFKPQTIRPKFRGSVRELLDKRIKGTYTHPQFQTDVFKPMDLEYLMDRKVRELSGGELQRVAICLALGKPADVYLLDEPSAYLDALQRIKTAKVIKRFILHTKKTAFVVEHDFIMGTYLADRVIVFDGEASISCTANKPTDLLSGMNKFLKMLNITFRRDPNNFRPRINKLDSVKDREQKKLGSYFFHTTGLEGEEAEGLDYIDFRKQKQRKKRDKQEKRNEKRGIVVVEAAAPKKEEKTSTTSTTTATTKTTTADTTSTKKKQHGGGDKKKRKMDRKGGGRKN